MSLKTPYGGEMSAQPSLLPAIAKSVTPSTVVENGPSRKRRGRDFCGCGIPITSKSWYCNACKRELARKWRQNNPLSGRLHARKWNRENREKRIAQKTVHRAMKAGRLFRSSECSKCGDACIPHAHHED